MKKNLLFLLFIFSIYHTALATSYKVKTEEQMKNAVTKLKAGDVILISNGSYTNWAIEIPSIGTKSNPILIKAETEGKVIFSGNVNETIFKLTGEYVTLKGILFKNCTLLKEDGKTGIIIELNNAKNCTIFDCSFVKNQVKSQFMPLVIISGNGTANKVELCVFEGNIDNQDLQVKITKENCPQFTLIYHNLFQLKNKVSWKNGNGGECVQIGQDPVLLGNIEANTLVKENMFNACNGESEIISNKSSKNSYVNNHFTNNDGELVMRGGHDCLIDRNLFMGGTGGIRVNGTGHIITNNQITNIKTAIRLMYGMAKGKDEIGFYIAASNCTISNNKITNAVTGILIGDSKDVDWTGKFDTKRYPSPVLQNIAPFNNKLTNNTFKATLTEQLTQ